MGITNAEEQQVKKGALVLRAINHKLRKSIYNYLLQNGKQTVTTIYRHFNVEQAVASQHLAILRKNGFVKTERDRRFVFYSANEERLKTVVVLCKQLDAEQ